MFRRGEFLPSSGKTEDTNVQAGRSRSGQAFTSEVVFRVTGEDEITSEASPFSGVELTWEVAIRHIIGMKRFTVFQSK